MTRYVVRSVLVLRIGSLTTSHESSVVCSASGSGSLFHSFPAPSHCFPVARSITTTLTPVASLADGLKSLHSKRKSSPG